VVINSLKSLEYFDNPQTIDYVRMHLARYREKFKIPSWMDEEDFVQEVELAYLHKNNKYDPTMGNKQKWEFVISRNAVLNILIRWNNQKRNQWKEVYVDDAMPIDDMPYEEKLDAITPETYEVPRSDIDDARIEDNIDRWVDDNIAYVPHRPIAKKIVRGKASTKNRYHYPKSHPKHKKAKQIDNVWQVIREIGRKQGREKILEALEV